MALIAVSGCAGLEDESEPASLVVSVKSSDISVSQISSLSVWAYSCDAQGEIIDASPNAFGTIDGDASVSLSFLPESSYYMIFAVANFQEELLSGNIGFTQLTASSFSEKDVDVTTRCKLLDMTAYGETPSQIKMDMELFPVVGRLNLSVASGSDMMDLFIKDISVCCAAAPAAGALFSRLTPDQIIAGGEDIGQWWFKDYVPSTAGLSESIVSDVTVSNDYVSIASSLLFENIDGWSDISSFASEGFNSVPSGCNGYYLAITYRYTVVPGVSANEDVSGVYEEVKYIPLAPVCRGNEYNVKLKINLGKVYVWGNTEVSEEVGGVW